MDYIQPMLTIAELSTFIRNAEKLLDAGECQDVISYLAQNPKAGDIIKGTGGVRVIYYFHNESMPLYLLALFAKNERTNLSKAQHNELSELTTLLVRAWQRKRNEH